MTSDLFIGWNSNKKGYLQMQESDGLKFIMHV
jgi:hypothetical protein